MKPELVHGVGGADGLAVDFGGGEDLGFGEVTAEVDEQLDERFALFWVFFQRTVVLDADGEGVVVSSVEGVEVADDCGKGAGLLDVERVADDACSVDDVVVSAVTVTTNTRHTRRVFGKCFMDENVVYLSHLFISLIG